VRAVLLAVVILASAVAACSSGDERGAPRDFCETAAAYDERVPTASIEEEQRLVEKMVETAPAEIKPAATRVLEGYERLAAGEDVLADEERYREATEDLQRFAVDNCGLLDQRQPGGI
jgi:hypothetical protein